jgi:hypothetical protein
VARRVPKRQAALKSARLEEKLDDLVSLLRSHRVPEESQQDSQGGAGSHNSESGYLSVEDDTFTPSTNVTGNSSAASVDVYLDEPSPAVADENLKRFREEMIVGLPVFIPSDSSICEDGC